VAGEPTVTESMLELLTAWLARREAALTSVGITISITRGARDRNPASVWVDFATSNRSARLVLWDNGLADLTVGDFVRGEVLLDEHREITTDVGLDDVEATVVSWLAGRP